MKNTTALHVVYLGLIASCASTSVEESNNRKQQYVGSRPLAADGADPCAVYDWYDDGICDTFCAEPDPDCGGAVTECTSDAHCANDEKCIAGDLCAFWCEVGDPTCCAGNTCQSTTPQMPPEGNECTTDSDCGSGERCKAGEYCLHWCEVGDPTCCSGNTCETVETVDENECTSDSDCASGQTCVPGDYCLYWCEVGDPACCSGNTCQ